MNRRESGPRGLGTWLAVAAIRSAPGESSARVAVGVVAVLVTLVGLALAPTALARSERAAANVLTVRPLDTASSGILLAQSDDYFEGRPIAVRRVAVVGDRRGSAAGLAIPGPGELVASPALREALATEEVLRARYPGRVVGTVPDHLLGGPRSLVLWVGTTSRELGADAGWLVARGGAGGTGLAQQVPTEIAFAVPMLVLGFLMPLVALLALLSTLGGARREQRLAALRLLGIRDGTAKTAACTEACLIAVASVVLGGAAFLLLDGVVAADVPVAGGVWSADVRLPWQRVAAVALGFPALAALAGWLGLRGVTTSPLGVVRNAYDARPRSSWLAVASLGAALVLVPWALLPAGGESRARATILGAGLVTVGLAGSVPLLVRRAARTGLRRHRGVSALLAFRRLERDPGRAARISVGLTLAVSVSGPLLMFFPLIADAGAGSLRDLAGLVGGSTIVSTQGPADDPVGAGARREHRWAAALRTPGIRSALTLSTASLGPAADAGREPDPLLSVVVADCDELAAVTMIDAGACARGLRVPGAAVPRWRGRSDFFAESVDPLDGTVHQRGLGAGIARPDEFAESPQLAVLLDGLASSATLLLPRTSVRDAPALAGLGRTVITVPAGPDAVEEVRTGIIRGTGVPSLTVAESDAIARRTTREFLVVAGLAGVLVVAIAGLATAVAALEQARAGVRERRLLRISGAGSAVVLRADLLQLAVPVLVGVLPATATALVLARAFADLLDHAAVAVPTTPVLLAATAAVGAPLLVGLLVGRATGASPTVLGE